MRVAWNDAAWIAGRRGRGCGCRGRSCGRRGRAARLVDHIARRAAGLADRRRVATSATRRTAGNQAPHADRIAAPQHTRRTGGCGGRWLRRGGWPGRGGRGRDRRTDRGVGVARAARLADDGRVATFAAIAAGFALNPQAGALVACKATGSAGGRGGGRGGLRAAGGLCRLAVGGSGIERFRTRTVRGAGVRQRAPRLAAGVPLPLAGAVAGAAGRGGAGGRRVGSGRRGTAWGQRCGGRTLSALGYCMIPALTRWISRRGTVAAGHEPGAGAVTPNPAQFVAPPIPMALAGAVGAGTAGARSRRPWAGPRFTPAVRRAIIRRRVAAGTAIA